MSVVRNCGTMPVTAICPPCVTPGPINMRFLPAMG